MDHGYGIIGFALSIVAIGGLLTIGGYLASLRLRVDRLQRCVNKLRVKVEGREKEEN